MDTKGKANEELREELKKNRIPFWKLGEALGVSEQTVVRWFRTPLSAEKKLKVTVAIYEISTRG